MIRNLRSQIVLEKILANLSPQKISQIEQACNISFDDQTITPQVKINAMRIYVSNKKAQKNFEQKNELIQTYNEGQKENAISNGFGQLSKIFEQSAEQQKTLIEEIAKYAIEKPKQGEVLYLPGGIKGNKDTDAEFQEKEIPEKEYIVSVTNTPCVYNPELGNVVLQKATNLDVYHLCTLARAAQARGMSSIKVMHSNLLEQANCPLKESGNIRQLIPGVKWFFRHDKCPLYTGLWYHDQDIKKGQLFGNAKWTTAK